MAIISLVKTALWLMLLDITDANMPTLVLVVVGYFQATSHYLSQCLPRSMSPYDDPGPQWVGKHAALHWPVGPDSAICQNLSQLLIIMWTHKTICPNKYQEQIFQCCLTGKNQFSNRCWSFCQQWNWAIWRCCCFTSMKVHNTTSDTARWIDNRMVGWWNSQLIWTHCSLVMPIWWHTSGSTLVQAITWPNVDLSSKVLCVIHLRAQKPFSWSTVNADGLLHNQQGIRGHNADKIPSSVSSSCC